MVISNGFIERTTSDGEIQRQLLDGTGRILDADGVTKRVRHLLLQDSRRVSDVTALLSENIVASHLPDGRVIDKHTGSIPDLVFEHDSTSAFCEVKTAARGNWIVFKREQAISFLDIPNCYMAFTEHNMYGVRQMAATQAGKRKILSEFALGQTVILPMKEAWKFYEALTTAERLNSQRGLLYKATRMSHVHRFVQEKKWKTRNVEDVSTLLVGKAREIELILDRAPEIMTIGRARKRA